MNELRIIIAGTRSFDNFYVLTRNIDNYLYKLVLDKVITDKEMIKFISGTAKGADQLGEQYAKACGCEIVRFYPDWDKYGKSAGYIRNKEMAKYASEKTGVLFAFWDGESKGTKHMIDLAYQYELDVHVINYTEDSFGNDELKILKPENTDMEDRTYE